MKKIISGRKVIQYLGNIDDSQLAQQFLSAVLAHSRELPGKEMDKHGGQSNLYELDVMSCATELSDNGFAMKKPEVQQLLFTDFFMPDG